MAEIGLTSAAGNGDDVGKNSGVFGGGITVAVGDIWAAVGVAC